MTSDESRLRLADCLAHMLEAIRLAREYVAGVSKDDFIKDRRTQQAVVLNLITIGEATSRIVTEHRIVLSPFAAKRRAQLLQNLMKEYETRYGALSE